MSLSLMTQKERVAGRTGQWLYGGECENNQPEVWHGKENVQYMQGVW